MENDPTPALKTNARVVLDRLLKNRDIKVPTEPEVISAVEKAIQMLEVGDPDAAVADAAAWAAARLRPG